MHIGRNVAKAREIIGIKQDEMAKYFKITQQAYILNGSNQNKSMKIHLGRYVKN